MLLFGIALGLLCSIFYTSLKKLKEDVENLKKEVEKSNSKTDRKLYD